MELLITIFKLLLITAGLIGIIALVTFAYRAYVNLKEWLAKSIDRHDSILVETRESVSVIEKSLAKFIEQLMNNDRKLRTHMMKLTGEMSKLKKDVVKTNIRIDNLAHRVKINPEELNDKAV